LQFFKEKAMGDAIDEFAAIVALEIKKEFSLIKNKCFVETRKRCEAMV
jgi:hypothetical protein